MSSNTADAGSSAEQSDATERDGEPSGEGADSEPNPDPSPLQIVLPDGSESVSDAIVTHREMLVEPQDHGLATQQEIAHLSEALESLSGDIEETSRKHDESRADVDELQELVARQRRQIDELQSMVASLAGILGTETEWRTFDDGADADDADAAEA